MANLRERQKEMTINLILDAADELFHEKGFDGTRTADIAALAGVSEGTLYNYFSSKSEMMMKMIEKKVYKEGNEFVVDFANGSENPVIVQILDLTSKQWGWASKVQKSHLRKVFSEFIGKAISENQLSQMIIKNDLAFREEIRDILMAQNKHSKEVCIMQCAIVFDMIIMAMQNFAIIEDVGPQDIWSELTEKMIYLMETWGY